MKNCIQVSLLLLTLVTGTSCGNKQEEEDTNSIVIGYREIKDEMAGSAYRTRARNYFVIQNQDTSSFSCFFSEAKADSSINVHIEFHKDLSYDQQLKEMKLIFPRAAQDFNMKRLTGLGLGRLVESGDLAVRITQQYREQFGDNTRIGSYAKISQFLMQSPLRTDFNNLLLPYGPKVEHISVEKVFFTDKKVLYSYSKLITDSAAVPELILDCMTWVSVVPET